MSKRERLVSRARVISKISSAVERPAGLGLDACCQRSHRLPFLA